MGLKYSSGVKRCTECQVFMDVDSTRCPCCNTKLRTRSRNKKSGGKQTHHDTWVL